MRIAYEILKRSAFLGLILGLGGLSPVVKSDPSVWLGVPFQVEQMMIQKPQSEDCGPTALFNALFRGNEELLRISESLPGNTLSQKYDYLMAEITQRPSADFPDLPRTRAEGTAVAPAGTSLRDMRLIIEDLSKMAGLAASPLQGQYMEREDEEGYGDFPERVHVMFKRSLQRKVPLVLAYSIYNFGFRQGGHYVTIFEVSRSVSEDFSFEIKGFDQLANKVVQFRVFEEKLISFVVPPLPGEPEGPRGESSSPFLKLSSKDLPHGGPGGGIPLVILEKAFGSFE